MRSPLPGPKAGYSIYGTDNFPGSSTGTNTSYLVDVEFLPAPTSSKPTLAPTAPTRAPTLQPTSPTVPATQMPTFKPTSPTTLAPTSATPATLAPTAFFPCYSFPPAPYQTLYDASVVPTAEQNDGKQTVVGVQMNFSVAGSITAIRYYRAQNENNPGNHWGNIWDTSGKNLAFVLFDETGCPSESWARMPLTTPLKVTPGTVYMVGMDFLTWYGTIAGGTSTKLTRGNVGTPGEDGRAW